MMELKKCTRQIENLKKIMPGYLGYYRMYYRNGWSGTWFDFSGSNDTVRKDMKEAVETVLCPRWPHGCDDNMRSDLNSLDAAVSKDGQRHLFEMTGEKIILFVLVDTTFGNNDYPIRIYAYLRTPKSE